MIAILISDGFEEIEALTPLDILRRAGLDARTVAMGSKIAVGSHGIPIICDMTFDEVNLSGLTAVIFPGGMPGSLNLDASPYSDKAIAAVQANGGIIAAICAAPLCLGRRGLLEGKRAVCYPGFENELKGATVPDGVGVVTDGNIITARGMGVATDFALALVEKILGKDKADEIAAAIIYKNPTVAATLIGDEKILLDIPPVEKKSKDECSEDGKGYLADKQFLAAVDVAIKQGKISTSLIQRKLSIGYGKAAKFIDVMEDLGLISEPCGQRPREVLITEDEWEKMLSEGASDNW